MSKHDLAARPIYHHKRQSVEANLNILATAFDDAGPHSRAAGDLGLFQQLK